MIEDIRFEACSNSPYVQVSRMHYRLNGVQSSWDVAKVHDSVAILLYHRQKEAFVLVKQFRPAVYLHNQDGYTYELCAGLVDKNKSLEIIACEEVLEECGYAISVASLQKITSFYTSVGFAGSLQTLFFALVDDTMKQSEGGGVETEQIELVFLPRDEMVSFIMDESKAKTPGLMFAFQWFKEHQWSK